jgi:hypothetical protein
MAFSRFRGARRPLESSSVLGLMVVGKVEANRRLRLVMVLRRIRLVGKRAREDMLREKMLVR